MQAMNRRFVLGLAGAMLAGAAMAQPTGPGVMRGPGSGRGTNDPVSYLARLKIELGITSDQEAAWGQYAGTVQRMATQMRALHAAVFEKMQTANWQERREMMSDMFSSRNDVRRKMTEAAQKLLPSLTPEQKSKAALSLPGLIGPGPTMGGGGMRPGMGDDAAAPGDL